MIFALTIFLVAVAFAFGVGGFTFFKACRRAEPLDWLDEAAVKKTAFGPFYENIASGHQWLQAHHAEDVYITSHDGLKLHALWVPAENAKGTAVLVHGYHSCALTDFSLAFSRYHARGMNLLLPTHRAHGKSEGKFITFGVLECRDILAWIRFHNRQYGSFPMLLSGMSMGAATVMFLADEELPDNVRAFNADCGFTSAYEIIGKVFRDATHIPAWPFLWATDLFARFFAGFSLYEKQSTKTLAQNTRPILLVHGLCDDFVPCEMTRRGYATCGGEKDILLADGATHGTSFLHAKELYLQKIERLMQACLKEDL